MNIQTHRPVAFLTLLLFVVSASLVSAQNKQRGDDAPETQSNDACKKEESTDKIKNDITPFRFDKTTTTKIFYKSYDQIVSVAIPVFYTTAYKLIINTEGMPTNVKVKISDRPKGVSSAKTLGESDSKHYSWEPASDFEGDRIYIHYLIPADKDYNTGTRNKGCVVLGVGYKNADI
jgi:hypothetical protein